MNDDMNPISGDSENIQTTSGDSDVSSGDASKRKILIGSQRNPEAYRPKKRDWEPIVEPETESGAGQAVADASSALPVTSSVAETPKADSVAPTEKEPSPRTSEKPSKTKFSGPIRSEAILNQLVDEPAPLPTVPQSMIPKISTGKIPPPNIRDRLSPDMEDELAAALGDSSLEDLLSGGNAPKDEGFYESETKVTGRIVTIRQSDVFVELGGREQGVVSLQQFKKEPHIGDAIEVVIQRINKDDGLYELSLPGAAMSIEDWSDLNEGMIVEARITGHNAGGLECMVNQVRGFIPVSQIALYRVENLEEFVGQQFTCLVAEANPERRNLILSRRALLEREREETRQKTLEAIQPGQVREGIVRKLMDFGAFVDLGGVDGLIHISQLGWGRVKHPSEVVQEGQSVKVRVEKVDPETGKISLSYKDLLESPWQNAANKYAPQTVVEGTVTRVMEYGAFVELEPGIEGLVHVSQLSHKRVWRVSDMIKEGDKIEAMVLSYDGESKRISLSMKALTQPEPEKKKPGEEEEEAVDESPAAAPVEPEKPKKPEKQKPLKGGLGSQTGAQFGLKW